MTRRRPPLPDRGLSNQELADTLRRFYDADRLPEIALVPLTLLAEVARRVKDSKEEATSTTGP